MMMMTTVLVDEDKIYEREALRAEKKYKKKEKVRRYKAYRRRGRRS